MQDRVTSVHKMNECVPCQIGKFSSSQMYCLVCFIFSVLTCDLLGTASRYIPLWAVLRGALPVILLFKLRETQNEKRNGKKGQKTS